MTNALHCTIMHCMDPNDAQFTLRLPGDLAQALSRRAKARGMPKAMLVREVLARYVAEPEPLSDAEFLARYNTFVGSVHGDHEAAMQDPLARQIYEHNFRE